MCNAYEQHVRWVEYSKMMQDLELGIPTQQTELDLPQSDLVRINDMAPVMRAAGNGVEHRNCHAPPGCGDWSKMTKSLSGKRPSLRK